MYNKIKEDIPDESDKELDKKKKSKSKLKKKNGGGKIYS